MAAPLTEGLSILLEHFEPNEAAPIRALPWTFVGTNTATTVVSAALVGTVATNYVGCLVEAMDGNQKGQRRLVMAFNAGTDTLTTEAWIGTANASMFALWVLPTPFVVASGAGASGNPGPPTVVAVTATDVSNRPGRGASEPWAGTGNPSRYALVCLAGANANRVALITGWAGGTFTLEPFGAWVAGAAGDLYLPGKLLQQHGGEHALGELAQSYIQRKFVQGHFEQEPGVLGTRTSAISFGLQIQGPTGVSSGATLATRPTELGDILDSMMAENADATTAISGATSTTTSLKVTTGQGVQANGRFRVGSVVVVDGEAAVVTAMADGGGGVDTMTITPALSAAPVDGRAVRGGVCYTPLYPEQSHRTHGFWLLQGGQVWRRMWGALPKIKFEGLLEDEVPRCTTEWTGDGHFTVGGASFGNFLFANERWPMGVRRLPRTGRSSRIVLGGTVIGAKSFMLDMGYSVQTKTAVTGLDKGAGPFVDGRLGVGTLSVWMDNETQIERFERGAELELLVQVGNVQGEIEVIYLPKIQYNGMPISKDNGGMVHEIPFEVKRSDITGDDGSGTIRRLADVTVNFT